MSKRTLSFYNLHCKFGDYDLLDFANEIVIPAMFKDYTRTYGDNIYFLHKVNLVTINNYYENIVGIAGKLVKNMKLKREQYYDESRYELVPDERSIESSPSSFFLIILNYHRVLFLKENRDAPSPEEFASTCTKFFNRRRDEYIDALKESNIDIDGTKSESKLTKKYLRNNIPKSKVHIVPLSSEANFSSFVDNYSVLRKVEVKFINTNTEIDPGDFFQQVRQQKSSIGAETTNLRHSTSRRDGLNKENIKRTFGQASEQGTSKIVLDGQDNYGEKLKGSNESFKVSTEVDEPYGDQDIVNRSRWYFGYFKNLLEQGIVSVVPLSYEKIDQIIRTFFR
jgi:hypothetical protein